MKYYIDIIIEFYNTNIFTLQIVMVLIIIYIYTYLHICWVIYIKIIYKNRLLITNYKENYTINQYKRALSRLILRIPLLFGFNFLFIIILLYIDLKFFFLIYRQFIYKVDGYFFNIGLIIFIIYILVCLYIYSKLTFIIFIFNIFKIFFFFYCILWFKIIIIKEHNYNISPFYITILNLNNITTNF